MRTTRRTKRGGQQGGLNEKDNDNNQIIKCLTFLESQAQVHFNDDNEEEEHKNEKEEDDKDDDQEDQADNEDEEHDNMQIIKSYFFKIIGSS